ncbi:MAG: DUF4407 domain-containing protein [Verrucomicrobiales bacterium]|nr:DUF4407 domain-containing protein [Verrucomicrobiales bacterium]
MKPLRIFSRLGGDSPQLLEQCSEMERMNSTSQGATLLLPIIIWFCGASATAQMMKAGITATLVAGAVAALFILLADRGMMAYLSKKGSHLLGIMARLLLAFAGSLVFAHPAVFFLAGGVIEKELLADKQSAIEARRQEIIPKLDKARTRLAASIDAHRQQAAATQSVLQGKEAELRGVRAQQDQWVKEADDEALGKRSGVPTEGPEYRRLMGYVTMSQEREKTLIGEVATAREQAARAQTALEEGMKATLNDPEIDRLQAEFDQASSAIRFRDDSDPFSQFEALHTVMGRHWERGSYSLVFAYLIVCGTVLGFEIIPLCLKMGNKGTELGLKVEEIQFKAEQDFDNMKQVYPPLAMQMMQARLHAETQKESLRLEHEIVMDNVRAARQLARSIMLEKAEVFEMTEDMLRRVPKKARSEHRQFAELLAKQLIDSFLASVQTAMRRVSGNRDSGTEDSASATA